MGGGINNLQGGRTGRFVPHFQLLKDSKIQEFSAEITANANQQ
jgi:hypothetical protein